jgi:ABC transporter substrate binding protein
VKKVLEGAKPADIPVEQPTLIELSINMQTAGALGIVIPDALLARGEAHSSTGERDARRASGGRGRQSNEQDQGAAGERRRGGWAK